MIVKQDNYQSKKSAKYLIFQNPDAILKRKINDRLFNGIFRLVFTLKMSGFFETVYLTLTYKDKKQ